MTYFALLHFAALLSNFKFYNPNSGQTQPGGCISRAAVKNTQGHPWLLAILLGILLAGWLPACIGVDKLSTKLQKEKHFAFFCKTVLGEIASHCTAV